MYGKGWDTRELLLFPLLALQLLVRFSLVKNLIESMKKQFPTKIETWSKIEKLFEEEFEVEDNLETELELPKN